MTGKPTADGETLMQEMLAAHPLKLRWDLTADQISALAAALVAQRKAKCDAVAAAHAAAKAGGPQLTWESIVQPLDEADVECGILGQVAAFPREVSADKAIRDASTEAETQLKAHEVEADARQDVFEAVSAYAETAEGQGLTGERRRYLEHKLRDFRRAGLQLDDASAAEVTEINTRIGELEINFGKNLAEENTSFIFQAAELDGMSAEYLAERRQEDGTFKVSLKSPCFTPLMEQCEVAETRQKMEKAYSSRCIHENTLILEELIELRHRKAKLLGFDSHAEFSIAIRMAGSAGKVKEFLSELSERLQPLLQADLAKLRQLKEADGNPLGGGIHAWDRFFYHKKLEATEYQVDHRALKEYFPLEAVTEGLLSIYQELLGLTFERDMEMEKSTWHEEVQVFKVSDSTSKELVGYFYMDIHPREGKYSHAADFPLQAGCEYRGQWIYPLAAMVCNFPKPTAEKPALLSHNDVRCFFHEFGHVMHELCSTAKMHVFSGSRVEDDFAEAPSQMLENWVWQPAALQRLSRHHKTGEPIPDVLLHALAQSRTALISIKKMKNVILAIFDQTIHTKASADTAAILVPLLADLPLASPGTNLAASFGHLAGGYDSQYYGYLWSEVYAADMFSRFEAEGIFSPDVGKSYREEILSWGASRDATDSLRAFLGRDPIQEPFLKSLGMSSA